MKSTFSVIYYLKRQVVKKDGTVPVMGRITVDGSQTQFSCKLTIDPKLWDTKGGRVTGRSTAALETNRMLDKMRVRINKHYQEIMERDNFVTAEKVKNAFLGLEHRYHTLMQVFQQHNEDYAKQVEAGMKAKGTLLLSEISDNKIELLCKRYEDIFTILTSYPELENYLSPFMDAWKGGAQDQLQGQIASAKIPLSRMISPQLYWVMTGNDFTLDINNPEDPKILCVGNNPDRQNIYSAALGLYNSRIVRLINKKGKLKSSIIIDELPTIYFRGLDNLIATARSNKVAVCLSFQDFSQLERDYGQEEAKVIENTVGNIFAGQVLGDTAKTLSERFGRIVQLRTSNSLSNDNLTTSTNTQLDSLIPASKISNLSQGMFVGAVADNFDERIEQKIFHAEIVIDREKLAGETASYVPIPEISSFRDADGVDRMEEIIRRNYAQIKEDVTQIIKRELRRIAEDPALRHLLAKK